MKSYIVRICYGLNTWEKEIVALTDEDAQEWVETCIVSDHFAALASRVELFVHDGRFIASWDVHIQLKKG